MTWWQATHEEIYACYAEEFPHYVDNLPEFRTFTRLAKMRPFMNEMPRRQAISLLGAGAVTGLAGCSSSGESTSTETATDVPTTSPTATQTATPTAVPQAKDEITAPERNRNLSIDWKTTDFPEDIASLSVHRDTVYVGLFDSTLRALDAASGEEQWSVELDNWVTLLEATESGIYAGAGSYLNSVDTDGTVEWSIHAEDHLRGVTVNNGTVYASDDAGYAYAVDIGGTLHWKTELMFSTVSDGQRTTHFGSPLGAPIVQGDTVYVTGGNYLWSLGIDDGSITSHLKFGESEITTQVVAAGNRLFYGGGPTVITAVNPDDGSSEWTFTPEDARAAGAAAPPVIAGDSMFVAANEVRDSTPVAAMYRLDTADGEVDQRTVLPGPTTWLKFIDGLLYALIDKDVYILDSETMSVAGYFSTDTESRHFLLVPANEGLYFTMGKTLYRLSTSV